jgi:hypothetical protein
MTRRVACLLLAGLIVSCASVPPDTPGRLSLDSGRVEPESAEKCWQYLTKTHRFRVDGEGVEVQLGGCVSAADVTTILRAIKRNEWTNQQGVAATGPWARLVPPMPQVNLSQIVYFRVPSQYLNGAPFEPSMYELWNSRGTHPNGRSGQSIVVVIRAGQVEVRSVGAWET